jgi:hypothetical protein
MFGIGPMETLILGIVGHAETIQANILSPTDLLIVGIVAVSNAAGRRGRSRASCSPRWTISRDCTTAWAALGFNSDDELMRLEVDAELAMHRLCVDLVIRTQDGPTAPPAEPPILGKSKRALEIQDRQRRIRSVW